MGDFNDSTLWDLVTKVGYWEARQLIQRLREHLGRPKLDVEANSADYSLQLVNLARDIHEVLARRMDEDPSRAPLKIGAIITHEGANVAIMRMDIESSSSNSWPSVSRINSPGSSDASPDVV